MNTRYGVLIVDDSAFMRRAISLLFEGEPDFYIVGIARNGEEAIEKANRFKPHVITMDIEMPEMDGLTALEEIVKTSKTPVVMLSTQTEDGADATIKALAIGAVDFYPKGDLLKDPVDPEMIKGFLQRVRTAARAKVRVGMLAEEVEAAQQFPVQRKDPRVGMLIIGCSTGGPSALQCILPRLPKDFPAGVVVIQHMPPGFTKPLADRFNQLCQLSVKEAENGDIPQPGMVLVASAGFQTEFHSGPDGIIRLKVSEDGGRHLYKPSVDVTLLSAAPLYREKLLVSILTGMGSDGLEGCRLVKKFEGTVLSEAEESCVVYGMPKVVFEAGLSDRQVSLSNMFPSILSYV